MMAYYHAYEQASYRKARPGPPDDGRGHFVRAMTRLTGISRTTLIKLLEDAGQAFSEYQDRVLVNLPCKRIQVDEAWAFCYAKQKNVPTAKAAPEGAGDIWTWVGLDADTKLVASWHVGTRDSDAAMTFIDDLAPRLASRVQLTSDGHKPYLEAIEGAFGADIDYAMLVKVYGAAPEGQRAIAPRFAPVHTSIALKDILIQST